MATFNLATIRSISILYVEDEQIIRDQMVKAYTKLFKEVFVPSNGKEALEIFTQNMDNIDIVISDINMPVVSGLEMSEQILAKKDIPIILTTAHTDKEYMLKAIDIGIKKYNTKPITLNAIVQDIEEVVTMHKKEMNIKDITKKLLLKSKNSDEVIGKLLLENKKLEEDNLYYKDLVDNYLMTLQIDKNGIIKKISKQLALSLMYSESELVGQNISCLKDTSCENISFQKQMLQAIHKKIDIESKNILKTKNNDKLNFEIKMILFYGTDDLVSGYNLYFKII